MPGRLWCRFCPSLSARCSEKELGVFSVSGAGRAVKGGTTGSLKQPQQKPSASGGQAEVTDTDVELLNSLRKLTELPGKGYICGTDRGGM